MNIKEFSHNLQNLYQEMSSAFSGYQSSIGWQCLPSCGKCCSYPDIEATALEMIPMAVRIFQEGKLEEWIEKLENSEAETCLVFDQGKCSLYEERPSVCRMFAVGGYYNKRREVTLSICKVIREAYQIQEVPQKLDPLITPIIADWTYRLGDLDQKLIQEKIPINKALYQALMKVALYAQYQG